MRTLHEEKERILEIISNPIQRLKSKEVGYMELEESKFTCGSCIFFKEGYCNNKKVQSKVSKKGCCNLYKPTEKDEIPSSEWNINESKKSDYTNTKEALMKSKSIDAEMKEKILQYLTSGSTYKEGGHIHGLSKPKELTDKTPKAEGVSMGADKKGFFVYTHRARSDSHETPGKIPVKEINFIESTG